jgi:hypothetical protein
MKKIDPSYSDKIKLPDGEFDDNFVSIINEIVEYIKKYFSAKSYTFTKTNDTKGSSIQVDPVDKDLETTIKQTKVKYPNIELNGNIISVKGSGNQGVTTQTTTKKTEPNVYDMAATKAISGGLIGESKLEKQINRIKKLL